MKMKALILLTVAMATLARAAVIENKPAPSTEQGDHLSLEKKVNVLSTGWTVLHKRSFLVVPIAMTWANAERKCQSLGGNLASVHNLTEYNWIQSLILHVTGSLPHTWIGGSDAEQEGTWFWSDGSFFSFSHWSPGQPDNSMSSHCLVMNFGDEKKLDDQLCLNKRISVCAKLDAVR